MSLVTVALETLALLERGTWNDPRGVDRDVRAALAAAVAGTRSFDPDALAALAAAPTAPDAAAPPTRIEVSDETTQVASHRLAVLDGVADVAVLDFASAVEPGGGFIRGARAQEEDLCRCSGLFPCLAPQRAYYARNRVPREQLWDPAVAERAHLYTDHVLYAPRVPFFRTRGSAPPDAPWLASVIVAPAPNAGSALAVDPDLAPRIAPILYRRAAHVLGLARALGHRALVLGAWGCGAFGNDPVVAADAFGRWLEAPANRGAFERVVFAVYDPRPPRHNLAAFRARFCR
ncbi:MAG: TIGR02452 family protein [Deltaproteobacteria bacterium HGW-Deltaproteobacteria-14]|jgi:uncharacterized protein (TIGR02452 family)|nr:MAG: TIGR02452 family protein [Deltaproteobacteria bacterium HGW-Deltaproteobacteria-14]